MTGFRASVELPVPIEVAYSYLSDPRNRPEWQSSLRSVTVPSDEEPHLGQRWQETMMIGVRPRMEIVQFQRPVAWAERGAWRGVEMTLALTFEETNEGCVVVVDGTIVGRHLYALPATVAGRLAALAVGGDLRKVKKILGRRTP